MSRKKSAHYVDNAKLLDAMINYRSAYLEAIAVSALPPRIPSYIGECIMKIAHHLAYRPNFAKYTFRDEMVSDGIENCLQYLHNFDPSKSTNPFAYFTQIIYYAFIRRIQKEKKYLYAKHAATQMAEINNATMAVQEFDTSSYKSDLGQGEWSQEQMERFMDSFEESRRKRRKKIAVGGGG